MKDDANFRIDQHRIWEIMNPTQRKTFGDLFEKRNGLLTEKEKKEWEAEFSRPWARFCMSGTPDLAKYGWNPKDDSLEIRCYNDCPKQPA
ncbi:hypothetical protein GGI43DRAFT_406302 [Trichoderma evansii]